MLDLNTYKITITAKDFKVQSHLENDSDRKTFNRLINRENIEDLDVNVSSLRRKQFGIYFIDIISTNSNTIRENLDNFYNRYSLDSLDNISALNEVVDEEEINKLIQQEEDELKIASEKKRLRIERENNLNLLAQTNKEEYKRIVRKQRRRNTLKKALLAS